MAHYEFDQTSGFFRIVFKFAGNRFKRSRTLKSRDQRRAVSVCGIVEETIPR